MYTFTSINKITHLISGFFHDHPSILASPHTSITFALDDVTKDVLHLFENDLFTPSAAQLARESELKDLMERSIKSANQHFRSGTVTLLSPELDQQGFSFASVSVIDDSASVMKISDDNINSLWFTDGPSFSDLIARKGPEARHAIRKIKSKTLQLIDINVDDRGFFSSGATSPSAPPRGH